MAFKNAKLTKAEQKKLKKMFDLINLNLSFISQLESKYKDTSLTYILESLWEDSRNALSHEEDLISESEVV